MSVADSFAFGAYLPRDSFLHRLDPRLKVVGFPALAVAALSGGVARLAALAFVASLLIPLGNLPWSRCWRSVRMLRWLLFFTVAVHLIFSPGRTLWGQVWLSRDGLEHGLLVAGQLALAVTFSSLLTLTTNPRELAAGLTSLLAPLRRFRLPVREAVLLFLLVLRFLPILREEALAEVARARSAGRDPGQGTRAERVRALGQILAPLLARLVDRADALALAAARGEDIWGEQDLPLLRLRTEDRLAVAVILSGLLVLFGLLP